jgi:putative FmdB family regulatory protein
MPTYDYLCSSCGHRFEEFQSMSAKPLRKCPTCQKSTLERLIGAGAGVIFKGSGFYQTDYRGGAYASDAKKDAAGACTPACGTDAAPAGCKLANKGGSDPK